MACAGRPLVKTPKVGKSLIAAGVGLRYAPALGMITVVGAVELGFGQREAAVVNRRRVWLFALPSVSLALFVVAMTALLWVLNRHDVEQQRSALIRDAQWAEHTISLHLQGNADNLLQIGNAVSTGEIDGEGFIVRASQLLANNPELVNVVWAGDDLFVHWAAPFETTLRVPGERLPMGASEDAFYRARALGRPAYSQPYRRGPGESHVIEIHVPVYRNRDFIGTITGLYSMPRMLRHLAPTWFAEKYQLSLLYQGETMAATTGVSAVVGQLTYSLDFDLSGVPIQLRASPFYTGSRVVPNMLMALVAGLLVLVTGSLWAMWNHMRRRVQAEKERDRMFSFSLDMLCIIGLDGGFRRVNPAFERILGYPAALLKKRSFLDFVHPDDRGCTEAEFKKLVEGEPAIQFENRCQHADGTYRWLLWAVNPVLEESLLFAVAHDITLRKEQEGALRAETAFRRAMEDSMVTGMRAVDMEGRITYVNAAFCRMTGYAAEELIGCRPPMPYWAPEEIDSATQVFAATMAGKAPLNGLEFRIRRKNGERVDAISYVSPLIDANGRQTGWMASMNDITERKRGREALRASHERFVAVMDGLDAAVAVRELNGGALLYANEAYQRAFGENCIGVDLDEGAEGAAEGEVEHPDGERWYYLRRRRIRWVDGREVSMEVATNVTARKQAEELTRQQMEKLQFTSRLITMGEMASSLAHELNQPLSAIANYNMGCVARLQAGPVDPGDLLQAMEKASFQAERAGKIIRRMRDFVKKNAPQRAPCCLNEIVDEAVSFAENEARNTGVRVHLHLAPDLPGLLADRVMLEQLMLNLVKNGIEAMREVAQEQRHLTVRTELRDGLMAEVSVIDRGCGIDPEMTEKLFSSFFTTKAEGMGMGLKICRSIVEAHNGRLWIEANPEGGSVFRVLLPLEG